MSDEWLFKLSSSLAARSTCVFFSQVVEKLCKGLNIPQKYNIFTLFEQCGAIEKNIEDRTVLADVLSKFEK